MAASMFSLQMLMAPMRLLARFFVPPAPAMVLPAKGRQALRAMDFVARNPGGARCAARFSHGTRPLRVVRLVDVGQAPHRSPRLRMSGRMADVCAELERLAAAEALH